MNTKLIALSGAALLAVAAPVAFSQTAPAAAPVAVLAKAVDIPYTQFVLKNGLRVIVHTDHKAPVVAVSVWYNVGSKMEPKGKTGFAHLFEHLMFNGSENAPGDFFGPLKDVGATDYNGTTYFDRTNYFETVPTPALARALFLESDRMGYLTGAITQGVLDEQRGVVQNEKRQDDNEPYGLVQYKQIEGLFPPGHPYGHTTIGSMADLDSASLADVKEWFRSHYGPNNAVLVLAGDVDVPTARRLVEKYFGGIPAGPKTVLPVVTIPTLPASKFETIKDRVATTRITRAWNVPGLNDPNNVALDVAAGVLGGGASSRLYQALVRGDRLAVRVRASNQSFSQIGKFEISVDVRPGVDPALVDKKIDAILADFLAKGPTADEVQRYQVTTIASRMKGLESVGGFGGKAVALASGALFLNDPGFYKKQLAELAAETPAAVKAEADKWLSRPVYGLTIVPGPRDAYEEAKVPPATAIKPAADVPAKGTRGPLPAAGSIANLTFPRVERARLSNGIQVIYAQRTATPVTRVSLDFDAGIAADDPKALGTQTLTLSSMLAGTASLDALQLSQARERLGAGIGAGADTDRTSVYIDLPSANLRPGMALLADVVRHPVFPAGEVERIRNQQLAAIGSELSNANALASRAIMPLVYGPQSPYAKAMGNGDLNALAKVDREDLIAFRQAWFRPDKATIFVVSDRPLAEVRSALESALGDWTMDGKPGVKGDLATIAPASPRIVLVDRPDSPQSVIFAGIPTALKGTDDLVPMEIANDGLGGGFLGRLNMDLREAKHWSYGAGAGLQTTRGATPYLAYTSVQADRTGDSIVAMTGDIADYVGARPMTQVEYDHAVYGAIRELPGSYETSNAVLGAMEQNEAYGRPDDYQSTLASRYRALTLAQLRQVMRSTLDPKKIVWVVVGDAKTVRAQLDKTGLPVEVVPAASLGSR
ncbi:pitrilysin family protein [Sphingomonas sp.]|jgi:predicted Zn-dependent peptidase|uniref:M16 family metallopeptidase n=1 Tax=Sphingomonas sp. TaxID=28214 RepID=UPI002E30A185|nr:pitrilysin family protein [Sphingomonas sp.]HEX4692922.1 pitrilysin family protein [Sphingomonas sp.]